MGHFGGFLPKIEYKRKFSFVIYSIPVMEEEAILH
jgi:hypothetical protein